MWVLRNAPTRLGASVEQVDLWEAQGRLGAEAGELLEAYLRAHGRTHAVLDHYATFVSGLRREREQVEWATYTNAVAAEAAQRRAERQLEWERLRVEAGILAWLIFAVPGAFAIASAHESDSMPVAFVVIWMIATMLALGVAVWAVSLWVRARWRERGARAGTPRTAEVRAARWTAHSRAARGRLVWMVALFAGSLAGLAVFRADSDTYIIRVIGGLLLWLGTVPGFYLGAAFAVTWAISAVAARVARNSAAG